MTAPLTVHNAEIKTAAVEIRMLTISGKQVTLAVFRQLREEPLIAEDGTLNGVPWGVVNYHPNKCADQSEHLHVVWQSGIDLRRSTVNPCTRSAPIPMSKVTEQWLDAAILDGWVADGYDPRRARPSRIKVEFRTGTVDVLVDEAAGEAMWPDPRDGDECARREREAARKRLRGRVVDTRGALEAHLEEELAAKIATRERHDAQWKALSDLPQLFIAV
ncbi:hypothetical protein [Spirillospora sp. NBC_01491]|uniref:hypothetical protein n=1 Tax=Spirillospora sp. NBC_01491 TaxID=2976007 RepID=UPI002E320EE8|nr:hypothetical protein [Spirillospora sp. NBC_01491]